MSVATEIARLQTAKADIKQSIENKGVTVPSGENISNYSSYIDSITQGVPTLDIGGKNPILIKEYHEEIPFSETNFPNITPSTSRQTIYSRTRKLYEPLDLENYDYAIVSSIGVECVYTEDLPNSSSYIIKGMVNAYWNFFKVDNGNYSLSEHFSTTGRHFNTLHKSNNNQIQIGTSALAGIAISNPNITLSNGNASVYDSDIQIAINANQMTADAFEKLDVEKTKIIFEYKLYRVDKGSTPNYFIRKKEIDWVLGE